MLGFGGQQQTSVGKGVLDQAAQAQQERARRITAAWQAYFGNMPKPLRVEPGQPDDNVRLSYNRLIVDKGVSFLFGDLIDMDANDDTTTEEEDDEDCGETPTDRILDAIWKQNRQGTLLHEVGITGGVCGDVFLKLTLPPGGKKTYPEIINLDPATVTPVLDPSHYKNVLEWRVQWNATDPTDGQPAAYRQTFVPNAEGLWVITDAISKKDNHVWTTTNTEVWPYSFCPIFHCQNLPAPLCFWGTSDLETDVLECGAGMSRIMSNLNKITRLYAHPWTVGTGFAAKDMQTAPGKVTVLPNPAATLKHLEMSSDLGSSLEIFKELKAALHEISRVPAIATGQIEGLGPVSGVALQILYQSLVEKTKTKRLLYGDLLQELNAALLEMASEGIDIEVTNHWPDILPIDDYQTAQTATLYDQLGVSKKTILTRLGFDYEEEAAAKAEEDKNATQMGTDMLSQFEKGGLNGQTTGQNGQMMGHSSMNGKGGNADANH